MTSRESKADHPEHSEHAEHSERAEHSEHSEHAEHSERAPIAAPGGGCKPIAQLTDSQVLAELRELIAVPSATVERRILLYLVRRYFDLGLRCYGPVQLHDGRRNRIEAFQELADLLFYLGKDAIEAGE